MVTHMSRKRRSKRHMKRHSKHSKTHITRNMYRKKHKKTQRGGGQPDYGKPGQSYKYNPFEKSKSGKPDKADEVRLPFQLLVRTPMGFPPQGWIRSSDDKDGIATFTDPKGNRHRLNSPLIQQMIKEFFSLKTRSGELLKVDMPADFLPPRWKKVGGEDGKEYVVEPDCSYIHPSESKDLKKILEYNYEKLMLEKHSKLSPAPSESPKLPTLHESPKSSTPRESPTSHKSPKSSKSSKSSKSK